MDAARSSTAAEPGPSCTRYRYRYFFWGPGACGPLLGISAVNQQRGRILGYSGDVAPCSPNSKAPGDCVCTCMCIDVHKCVCTEDSGGTRMDTLHGRGKEVPWFLPPASLPVTTGWPSTSHLQQPLFSWASDKLWEPPRPAAADRPARRASLQGSRAPSPSSAGSPGEQLSTPGHVAGRYLDVSDTLVYRLHRTRSVAETKELEQCTICASFALHRIMANCFHVGDVARFRPG